MSVIWHDYLFGIAFALTFTGLGFWLGWMLRG